MVFAVVLMYKWSPTSLKLLARDLSPFTSSSLELSTDSHAKIVKSSSATFWRLWPLMTCTIWEINFSVQRHHCVSPTEFLSLGHPLVERRWGWAVFAIQLVSTRNLYTETSCFHKHRDPLSVHKLFYFLKTKDYNRKREGGCGWRGSFNSIISKEAI